MSVEIAVLSTAFLCGTTLLLAKLCRMRVEVENPPNEYIFITKDHYEDLQRAAKREIIIEQPQLPVYSEKAPLLSPMDHDIISI
jgi:hypothetical protein